jgi:hypothetical protein
MLSQLANYDACKGSRIELILLEDGEMVYLRRIS